MVTQLKDSYLLLVGASQPLYGPETLALVGRNVGKMAEHMTMSGKVPCHIRFGGVIKDSAEVNRMVHAANDDPYCIGVMVHAHTFSPAMQWVPGLDRLHKPLLHLHTQFNSALPYDAIDMNYMNAYQAAHGDVELAQGMTSAGKVRETVVGAWESDEVLERINRFARIAYAITSLYGSKILRIGGRMSHVVGTEVPAHLLNRKLGVEIIELGVGELAGLIEEFNNKEAHTAMTVDGVIDEYRKQYEFHQSAEDQYEVLSQSIIMELAIRKLIERYKASGWTSFFGQVHGLPHLPALAAQRLMAEGITYGPEGDAAVAVAILLGKHASQGLEDGNSLIEPYTYDLNRNEGDSLLLGAHMAEICPSISTEKPSLQIHDLGVAGIGKTPRLVFTAKQGPAINASLVSIKGKLRLVVADVENVALPEPLPNLPVARAIWHHKPSFKVALECLLQSGTSHHALHSLDLTAEHMELFARLTGIDFLHVGPETTLKSFRQDLAMLR